MTKMKLPTAAVAALGLALGTTASIAAAQQPEKQPATGMMGNNNNGMMGNTGNGMMGNGGDMMGMMAQMNRMMENCNRMMESKMQPTAPAPAAPSTPAPGKKG